MPVSGTIRYTRKQSALLHSLARNYGIMDTMARFLKPWWRAWVVWSLAAFHMGCLEWIDLLDVSCDVVDVSSGGGMLFASCDHADVRIFSSDEYGAFLQVGSYVQAGDIIDSVLYGNLLYVSKSNGNVDVVDLSMPSEPKFIEMLGQVAFEEVARRMGYDIDVVPNTKHDILVYKIVPLQE